MRRPLLGLVVVAALAACSDSTPTGTRSPGLDRIRSVVVVGTLDENIQTLIGNWPKGHSNAIMAQWNTIKKKVAAGDLDGAKKKLFELSKFIAKKTSDMNEPAGDETKSSLASRLITYMALYVYCGPGCPAPDFTPGADNAVGFLTPDAPLTLVTPSGHAGAQFLAGSVNENRIIIISQNPSSYDECDGPLLTELCQYPLFYDFESFPAGPFLLTGKAAVCPVETNGELDAIHDQLRLAHPIPSNTADYVAGGTIRDTPASEENIEILPLITQNFVFCEDVEEGGEEFIGAGPLQRGLRFASALASRIGRLLSPRSAYAIDQGGGGGFDDFGSPFNHVDPLSDIPYPE